MPCYSGPSDAEIEHQNALKRKEAMLCAVLTAAEKRGVLTQILETIDPKEAGVSISSIIGWWESHKEADELRRQAEAAEAARREARASGLAKLTPAERRALGL